jgi:Zn-dependent M28 family amino/carboxypeptidase
MHVFTLLALLTVLQAPAASSPDQLVDEVRTLTLAGSNDDRFEAVAGMLRRRNLPFTVEPFTIETARGKEPRTQGRNIVVSIGDGAEEIVVGAHYDAVRLPDGSLSAGAVDNGASSVMLVHLAQALAAERLPVRVRIVWFDMEELGLLGSSRYAEAHAGDRILAMLNFDINAYGDTVLFGAPVGGEDARLRRAMIQTCSAQEIDCVRFARMPPGDDRSFGKAGIPTLSIAMLPALEVHQLWLRLQGGDSSGLAPGTTPAILRTIHTADDVLTKVDGASIARAERFATALVRHVSTTLRP